MIKKTQKEKKILSIFLLFTSITYIFASLYSNGPAYLSDEIGYLSKAAFLASHKIDLATSWHGGYSALLTPLFYIFQSPEKIWYCIIITNSILFTLSLYFSYQWIAQKEHAKQNLFALAATALYPTWVVMTSYAFPTACITFFFSLSVFLFDHTRKSIKLSIINSLIIGFIYWIHPAGIAAGAAYLSTLAYSNIRNKKYKNTLIQSSIILLMIILYKEIIHDWLSNSMNLSGASNTDHYGSYISKISSLSKPEILGDFISIAVMQYSYLITSTLGLISIGLIYAIKKYKKTYTQEKTIIKTKRRDLSAIYLYTSIIIVIALGSINFANTEIIRSDHRIYGRYIDSFIMPAIFLSFALLSNKKYRFGTLTFLSFIATLSAFQVTPSNTSKSIIWLNIASYWPAALDHHLSIAEWTAISMLGVCLFSLITQSKKLCLLFLAIITILCYSKQRSEHSMILSNYEGEKSLFNFLESNYKHGQCIGFDISGDISQSHPVDMYRLYTFNLHNYNLRRVSFENWKKDCDGPFLTYNIDHVKLNSDINIYGKMERSGLIIIDKKSKKILDKHALNDEDVFLNNPKERLCIFSTCYKGIAKDLRKFSRTSDYSSGLLKTKGIEGWFLFGPYKYFSSGKYKLSLDAEIKNPEGIKIDVKSRDRFFLRGNMESDSSKSKTIVQDWFFTIEKPAQALEFRIYTSSESSISLKNYRITKISDLPHKDGYDLIHWFNGIDLKRYSHIGYLKENNLTSKNKEGWFIFGPYLNLPAGSYFLDFDLSVKNPSNVTLDIRNKQKTFLSSSLANYIKPNGKIQRIFFQTEKATENIEIRLHLDKPTDLKIQGYGIYQKSARTKDKLK